MSLMTRSAASLLLLLAAAGVRSDAEESTRVSITPTAAGVLYRVDGQPYYTASSFVWPVGSKHLLEFATLGCSGAVAADSGLQYDATCGTRYRFSGWSDDVGAVLTLPLYVYTAHPSVSNIKLLTSAEHRIRFGAGSGGGSDTAPIPLPNTPCVGNASNAGASGLACIGGSCYDRSVELWLPAGPVSLEAYPFSGFVIAGWTAGSVQTTASHLTYRVVGPTNVVPLFVQAKQVRIFTDPPGMKVLVDRAEVRTADPADLTANAVSCPLPGHFDFAPGSVHMLAANSPQIAPADGRMYVFDSWSNGGGQNTVYRTSNTTAPETLVARFVPGIDVRFFVPAGLKLIVDGRDNWPVNHFVWAAGSKHLVTAPAEQYDANGRKYIFKGWTHGGAASQEIVADPGAAALGLAFTAEYEKLGMLLVQSDAPGVRIEVDGTECATPCTIHAAFDKPVRITASPTIRVSDNERLDFQGWKDGAAPEHVVRLGAEPVIISASYRSMFRLSAAADPPDAADIRMLPAAPDSYYPFNTRVQVFASARPGFKLKGWRGDAEGFFSPVTVNVAGARSVFAVFEPVPHVAPAGVRNAAAELPEPGVAPGSLVSVFGGMLTSGSDQARTLSPLPQRLVDTLVEVEGHVLPLLLVSPQQINAQLPADLTEGTHALRVRNPGFSEPVTAEFDVVRNAPGLFTVPVGNTLYVAAIHGDGSSVTPDNPARPGDTVTLVGTGLGPFRVPPPEGFGVRERPEYALLDRVEVVFGDVVLEPTYAGAGGEIPGTVLIRFRIPASTAAIDQDVFVRVNGKVSNKTKLLMRRQQPSGMEGDVQK